MSRPYATGTTVSVEPLSTLVGACSIDPFSVVAIPAEYLESLGVSIPSQPTIQVTSDLASVFVAAAINMIYGQELFPRFSATNAFGAVMREDIVSQCAHVFPLAFVRIFMIGFPPALLCERSLLSKCGVAVFPVCTFTMIFATFVAIKNSLCCRFLTAARAESGSNTCLPFSLLVFPIIVRHCLSLWNRGF